MEQSLIHSLTKPIGIFLSIGAFSFVKMASAQKAPAIKTVPSFQQAPYWRPLLAVLLDKKPVIDKVRPHRESPKLPLCLVFKYFGLHAMQMNQGVIL